VIAVYLLAADSTAELRAAYRAAPIPSLTSPVAVDAATAAELCARLDAAGTTPFDIADRGRYRVNDTLGIDVLGDELAALAELLTEVPARVVGWRWVRFGRGDYSLVKDDSRTRPPGPLLEATLDLSTRPAYEAEVVYSDGTASLIVPPVYRLLSVVERPVNQGRYERPPTSRTAGDPEITRLRVWLSQAR
jgi:hypothetical protein